MVEYPDETLNDVQEDAAIEDAEYQKELSDDIYGDSTTDTGEAYKEKDDLYSLFRWVIARLDSSKLGNLDKGELGLLDFSVRDCQEIALKGITFGHPGFARFFGMMSEVLLATSASKKGWQQELFVSQKKFSTRGRENLLSQQQGIQEAKPKKFGFFRRK